MGVHDPLYQGAKEPSLSPKGAPIYLGNPPNWAIKGEDSGCEHFPIFDPPIRGEFFPTTPTPFSYKGSLNLMPREAPVEDPYSPRDTVNMGRITSRRYIFPNHHRPPHIPDPFWETHPYIPTPVSPNLKKGFKSPPQLIGVSTSDPCGKSHPIRIPLALEAYSRYPTSEDI